MLRGIQIGIFAVTSKSHQGFAYKEQRPVMFFGSATLLALHANMISTSLV